MINVLDQSGWAVPGAGVELANEATERSLSAESNEQGVARFVSVRPSAYSLAVTAEGFRQHQRSGLVVQVAESVNLTAELEFGAVTEVVEVVGAAPLLQTEGGELGRVVEERKLRELPLNGRNPFALAALAPGVAPGQNFGNNPLVLANRGINGGRGGATEILIDGSPATVPENSPGAYATAVMPSVDRIQDFKVQTNSFSAESGRLGIGPRASTEQRRSLGPRRSGCSPGPCPRSSLQPPGDWPGSHQQFHCRRQRSKRRRQLRRPLPPPLHGHPYDLLPLELPRLPGCAAQFLWDDRPARSPRDTAARA